LDEAFKANTDLKAAEANLLASRAVLEGARDARFPQTNAGAAVTYGRDAATDEILAITGHSPQNIWIYEAVLSVGYELDYLGRVRRSIEAARADTDAVAAVHDSVKITVAAETARAYAQVCAIGEELQVARHSLEVVSREAQITLHRNEAGANSQFDVVRAEGLVAQVRGQHPAAGGTAPIGTVPARRPPGTDPIHGAE